MFIVYSISCPDSNEVKYIGQTEDFKTRVYNHLKGKELNKKQLWINSLLRENKIPKFEIIEKFKTRHGALKKELELIKSIGSDNLLNVTFKQTFYKWKLDGTFVDKVEGTRQELGNVRVNRLTSKGFVWSRENEFPKWKVDKYKEARSVNKKQVHQINKKGELIATFEGVRDAGRITGIDHRSISAVASGSKVRKTAGGYKWKYII